MNRGVSRFLIQADKVGDFCEMSCADLEYVRSSVEGAFGTARLKYYATCDQSKQSEFYLFGDGDEMSTAGISDQEDVRGLAWIRLQVTTAGSAGALLQVSMCGWGTSISVPQITEPSLMGQGGPCCGN